ncbi:MAG: ATP-binding protein [Eubacterium sp.]|nr:ATP-binding protein [Eubacterium sp.]
MQLQNYQYQQLISHYEKVQLKNARILENRVREIDEKIPAIKNINKAIAMISANSALKKLGADLIEDKEGGFDVAGATLDDIPTLSKKKKQLLVEAGYPENYLDPIYECPICHDTGYIDDQKCQCFKKRIIEYLYEESNLGHVLEKENFDHFDFNCYSDGYIDEDEKMTPRDNIHIVYDLAKNFCENFDKNPSHLLIYGTTGVGKTFLTHCIAKEILDKGHTVVYLSAIELFNILGKSNFGRDTDESELNTTSEFITGCDLLIIDDLGTELVNLFTNSQLYQIINRRIIGEQPTIISTNLSFQELEETYSERVLSRIDYKYTFLKIFGDDLRIKS